MRRQKGRMPAPNPYATMNNFTRYLGLAAKLLVFLLVLGFALKNSHPAVFYGYLGMSLELPLIVMLGLAFVLGALTGLLALLPTVFRLRRVVARQTTADDISTVSADPV